MCPAQPSRRPGQLPPGRHKLSREQVAESQRTRILDGIISAVAELGYEQMRLSDVIERAGVSRKTFYEYYSDREDCFLAAYDMHVAALTEATSEGFSSVPGGPWADQIRAGVRAFLDYVVNHPDAAKACLIEVTSAGRTARARRDAALRSFTFFIDSGRGEAAHEVPGRTALAVLGGLMELIAAELVYGSPGRVGALAPDIVYMICLPFLGPERALEERAKTLANP